MQCHARSAGNDTEVKKKGTEELFVSNGEFLRFFFSNILSAKPHNAGMNYLWTDAIPTHRVVVVEWLLGNDRRTGTELVDAAARFRFPRNLLELHRCRTRSDVLDCIARIELEVPSRGVPILHIEAHGVPGVNGGFAAGSEQLTWGDLRAPLSALNVATRFNLLVVGASCYGDGPLWALGAELAPAPFIGCVGFSREIEPGCLLRAMTEFYRGLIVRGENVEVAVEAAQREIKRIDHRVRFTSVRDLMRISLRKAYEIEWKSRPDAAAFLACESVLAAIMAYNLFPENHARFNIDVKELLSEPAARAESKAESIGSDLIDP